MLRVGPVRADAVEGGGGGRREPVWMGRRSVIPGQVGEGEGGLGVPGHELPVVAHEAEEGPNLPLGGWLLGGEDSLQFERVGGYTVDADDVPEIRNLGDVELAPSQLNA